MYFSVPLPQAATPVDGYQIHLNTMSWPLYIYVRVKDNQDVKKNKNATKMLTAFWMVSKNFSWWLSAL